MHHIIRTAPRTKPLIIIAGILVAIGVQQIATAVTCVTPPSGLVSWWRGEGNALDSADSNQGTLIGNAAYASGRVGQAFSFDGNGDAIFIGNPANLQLQNLTIEGWVKRSSVTLVSAASLTYGNIVGYGPGGYVFGFRQDGSLILSKNTVDEVRTVGTITDTAWHHVAVTKNGSAVVFYLDGVAEPSITYNTTFQFTTDLMIGAVDSSVDASFLGMIDELAIYNRALNAAEIQALYSAGNAGKCPPPPPPPHCTPAPAGLVSWWRAESNALDSADGNNGTLQNGATFAAGKVGQAFSFNGVDADVRVPAAANLDVGTGGGLTIETWINPADVSVERPIAEWNSGSFGAHFWIAVGVGSGGSGPSSLYANLRDVNFIEHKIASAAGIISSNVWQHVAVTYDKSSGVATLYLNGSVVAQTSLGIFTPRTTGDLYFGLRPFGGGAGTRFVGQLDEIAIYNRALSANEIQAVFSAGSAGKCPPPPPVNHAPVANSQSLSVNEDTTNAVALTGSDLDGDPLTFIVVSGPTNGTLSGTSSNLTYKPNPNYFGADGFRFKVNDGHVDSAVATVNITVLPVNDPPVANSQSVNVNEDTPVAITLTASDVDGDALTYTVTPPAHGTLSGTAPNLTYKPGANYFGPDGFTFKANDGHVDSAVAVVSIHVISVNDAPVARATVSPLAHFPGLTNLVVISPNNTNAPVVLDGSLSTDVENDPLQYTWLEGTNVLATVVVTTNRLNVGTHVITLAVSDGTDFGMDTVSVEVITPAQSVGILIAMVNDAHLLRKYQRPLVAALKASAAAFDDGRFRAGKHRLEAFQNKVRAQIVPLDQALADKLINAAQVILDAVITSGPGRDDDDQ